MINEPPPFKGLNIRIPTIISIKGRGSLIRGKHYFLTRDNIFKCDVAILMLSIAAAPVFPRMLTNYHQLCYDCGKWSGSTTLGLAEDPFNRKGDGRSPEPP